MYNCPKPVSFRGLCPLGSTPIRDLPVSQIMYKICSSDGYLMYKTPEFLGALPPGPHTNLCPSSVTNKVSTYGHLTVIKCLYPLSFWELHPLTPAEKRSAGPACKSGVMGIFFLSTPSTPKRFCHWPLPLSPYCTNIWFA